jgi:hypothetical protein
MMTSKDEIIEMARQAGFTCLLREEAMDMIGGVFECDTNIYPHLEAFAKLVEERTAAKATDEANARANSSWTLMCKKMVELEREACATVCDDLYRVWTLTDEDDLNPPDALDCKRAIQARAQADGGDA